MKMVYCVWQNFYGQEEWNFSFISVFMYLQLHYLIKCKDVEVVRLMCVVQVCFVVLFALI